MGRVFSYKPSANSSIRKTSFTLAFIGIWCPQFLSLLYILIYKLSSAVLILLIWSSFLSSFQCPNVIDIAPPQINILFCLMKSTYFEPDIVISTLQKLNYTVPEPILWDRHFTDEETDTKKRLSKLPKFTTLVNGNPGLKSHSVGSGIQTLHPCSNRLLVDVI